MERLTNFDTTWKYYFKFNYFKYLLISSSLGKNPAIWYEVTPIGVFVDLNDQGNFANDIGKNDKTQ